MRRVFIITILILVCSPLAAQEKAQPEPTITPDQLWSALMTGNKQYVAGSLTYSNLKAEREQLKEHQLPPITVLGCSDSRVPPELVFNQSLGALFVVRSAGNVVDDFGLGSIEFAMANGYTRLIVVLGHENCGAVKASLGGADPETPAMTELATRIRSSFVGIPYDSRDAANVKKAVEANTRASVAQLLAMSKLIRDSALTERIKIIPAYYELGTGVVKVIE